MGLIQFTSNSEPTEELSTEYVETVEPFRSRQGKARGNIPQKLCIIYGINILDVTVPFRVKNHVSVPVAGDVSRRPSTFYDLLVPSYPIAYSPDQLYAMLLTLCALSNRLACRGRRDIRLEWSLFYSCRPVLGAPHPI